MPYTLINNQFWEGLFRGLWWAQNGAPALRVIEVRDRLNEVFGENRVIALQHNVEWPPRSPDLTPCDFFLWGYLKNKVFTTPPENISMCYATEEFNALGQQPEMIRHVISGMHRRTIRCVERNGGHVEGHGP